MSTDTDSKLRALFAAASEDIEAQAFAKNVMAGVDQLRRRTMYGWATAGVLLVVVAAMIASPVQDAIGVVTQLLPQSVVQFENRWAAQLLSPINSIAGVAAVLLLVLRAGYRKIFS